VVTIPHPDVICKVRPPQRCTAEGNVESAWLACVWEKIVVDLEVTSVIFFPAFEAQPKEKSSRRLHKQQMRLFLALQFIYDLLLSLFFFCLEVVIGGVVNKFVASCCLISVPTKTKSILFL